MAKGKKSFVLYSDQKELFEHLTDEQSGKLIKHIFRYVNDENPVCDDAIVNLAFITIKASLKRDLQKWEKQLEQRSAAGKASAKSRQRNSTTVNERQRNSTDNVSVNVNDNVNEKNINEGKPSTLKTLNDRKIEFGILVKDFVGTYTDDMCKRFFNYWTESNVNGKKMRFEMEKVFDLKRRLATWAKNDKEWNKDKEPIQDKLVEHVKKATNT